MIKKKIFLILFFNMLVLGNFCWSVQASEPEMNYIPFSDTEICKEEKQIYVILKAMQNQYWQILIKGIEDAQEEFSCQIHLGGILDEQNTEDQIKLMHQAIKEGADAILLAPADSGKLIEPCHLAKEAGIPVITVDTAISSDDYDVCFMTDNLNAGMLGAKEILKKLKEDDVSEEEPAEVAIQLGATVSQTMVNRVAGFTEYWAEYAPKKWKITNEIMTNGGNVEQAYKICQEYLEKYPDIKAVFGCNNSSTIGFVKGIQDAGRTDLILVGFDYADETLNMIKEGEYQASTIVQKQYQMGYNGIQTALDLLEGKKPELKFIDTGIVLVDHTNVFNKEIQELLK